jgi:hypothetical protein
MNWLHTKICVWNVNYNRTEVVLISLFFFPFSFKEKKADEQAMLCMHHLYVIINIKYTRQAKHHTIHEDKRKAIVKKTCM